MLRSEATETLLRVGQSFEKQVLLNGSIATAVIAEIQEPFTTKDVVLETRRVNRYARISGRIAVHGTLQDMTSNGQLAEHMDSPKLMQNLPSDSWLKRKLSKISYTRR